MGCENLKWMKKTNIFSILLIIGLLLPTSCGKEKSQIAEDSALPEEWFDDGDYVEEPEDIPNTEEAKKEESLLGAENAPMSSDSVEKANAARIRIEMRGNLAEIFNDSNYRQYAYAEKLGIKPIHDLGSAYFTSQPIEKVKSNENFAIAPLTHSLPYLVPQAHQLLNDIGKSFKDSLKRRGGSGYRIRVTSLLRTPSTVKRLRRVNPNATDSSTHQFGTTFDLSWTNFEKDPKARYINDADLKNLLGEVLKDKRAEGRCLVKFERKTCCYHITVTR